MDGLQVSFSLVPECKVVDGSVEVLTRLYPQDGENYALAEVSLPEFRPKPQTPQPQTKVLPLAYFSADVYMPLIAKSMYRKGKQKWKSMEQNAIRENKSNTQ